jgi:hypothetical protein
MAKKKKKNILKQIRHYWVIIFLAILALSLIFLRLKTEGWLTWPPGRKPAEESQQQALSLPQFKGQAIPTDYQINFNRLPKETELKVYQSQPNKLSEEQAQTIADHLDFSQPPNKTDDIFSGPILIWNSDIDYLSISLNTHQIDYGLSQNQPVLSQTKPLPSPEIAQEKLEELLTQLKIKTDYEKKWQKEEYLLSGFYPNPTPDLQKADLIKVGFNPALDQFQLIGQNPKEPMVSLILNKNQQIVRFRYQIHLANFEAKSTFELKDKELIQKKLLVEGSIVSTSSDTVDLQKPNIIQANFDQIHLAYFQKDSQDFLIQPIFVMSGTGATSEGDQVNLIAYLPAIDSRWLKTPPAQINQPINIMNIPFL